MFVVGNVLKGDLDYIVFFFLGGYGFMVGLLDDKNVGKLFCWIEIFDWYFVVVCYGFVVMIVKD